jgi:hypothetical protein
MESMREKMVKTLKQTIENEHGFVLGTSILVSAVLILAGVFAVWMANTEMLLVRNESQMIREFYSPITAPHTMTRTPIRSLWLKFAVF